MDRFESEEPSAAPSPSPPPRPATQPASLPGHPLLEGVTGLREGIFDRLVEHESDVTGLLAYSLSMQIKREWLAAFHAETGRDPTPEEMQAFDVGERIDRRLATYRKLAENALSGNAFWASTALTPVSEMPGAPAPEPAYQPPPRPASPPAAQTSNAARIAGALGIFVLLVVVALVARHFMGV